MKTASVTLLCLLVSVSVCQAQELACPKDLKLLEGAMPDYPSPEQAKPYLQGTSYMHVFIEGSVSRLPMRGVVRSAWERVGRMSRAVARSFAVNRVGRSGGLCLPTKQSSRRSETYAYYLRLIAPRDSLLSLSLCA